MRHNERRAIDPTPAPPKFGERETMKQGTPESIAEEWQRLLRQAANLRARRQALAESTIEWIDYAARYARLIMQQEPDLDGLFELRAKERQVA